MNLRPLPALLVTVLLTAGLTACSDDSSPSPSSSPDASSGSPATGADEGPRTQQSLEESLLSAADLPAGAQPMPLSGGPVDVSVLCPDLELPGAAARAEFRRRWQETGQEVTLEVSGYPSAAAAEEAVADLPQRLLTCLTEAAADGGPQVGAGEDPRVGDESFSVRLTSPQLNIDFRLARAQDVVVGAAVSWRADGTEPELVDSLLRDQVARVSAAG